MTTTPRAIHFLVNPSKGRKFMFILDNPERAEEYVAVILRNTSVTPELAPMQMGISESFEGLIKADEGLANNFLRPSSPTKVAHITFMPEVCYNMSRETARYLWKVLVISGFVMEAN